MGFFDDHFGGDLANWADNITFQNGTQGFVDGMFLGQVGIARDIYGNLTKAPDYSGPLDAAAQQLENEKKRRANEANRKDVRSSQLARLFLSEDGTNFNTPSNSFMG